MPLSTIPSRLRTAKLASGAQLFVWSLRTWRRLTEDRSLPRELLATPYRYCGAVDALESLEELMWLLDRGAIRVVQIGRPFGSELSVDELQLLAALRLASISNAGRARTALERFFPPAFARTAARLLDSYARAIGGAGLSLARQPEVSVIENTQVPVLPLQQAT